MSYLVMNTCMHLCCVPTMDSKTAVLSGASAGGTCTKHAERMHDKNDLYYSVTINELTPVLIYLRYEEPLKECRITTLETRILSGGQIDIYLRYEEPLK